MAVLSAVVAATACQGGNARRSASPVPFVAVDANSAAPTDRAIAAAQQRLRDGDDDQARLELAQAFLQKAREVADPSLYVKARGLLDGLAGKRPRDISVLVTSGTLALAQHRFSDALSLGDRAVRLAPSNPTALGVVVDADNELGRYDAALDATQRMVDAKPNLASLSRVSYARELRGDLAGAVTAMTQAVASGGGGGENLAYVQVQLGNLLLTTGDLAGAEASYAAAEQSFPGVAAARAGRARLLVAQGRPGEAAEVIGQVLRTQPLAEYAIARGDDLAAAGRPAEAAVAFDLVGAIARLYAANGVNVDLEMSLFDADHHPGPTALARARKALAERPSTLAHDVVAWHLFKVGRYGEAAKESARALRLGSQDPQERFHAAAIAMANGNAPAATEHLRMVLGTNPRFSAAYVPQVEELAAKLGLQVPPVPTSSPPP